MVGSTAEDARRAGPLSGGWAWFGQRCRGGCTVRTALFGFVHVRDGGVDGQDDGSTAQLGEARKEPGVAWVGQDPGVLCGVTTMH